MMMEGAAIKALLVGNFFFTAWNLLREGAAPEDAAAELLPVLLLALGTVLIGVAALKRQGALSPWLAAALAAAGAYLKQADYDRDGNQLNEAALFTAASQICLSLGLTVLLLAALTKKQAPEPSEVIRIESLWVYPVKSCRGVRVPAATLDRQTGIEYDRLWMVVCAETGSFISQRRCAALTLVEPCLPTSRDEALVVEAPRMKKLTVPVLRSDAKDVRVWAERLRGSDQGEAAAEWFSAVCGIAVRLVRMDESSKRLCDREYASRGATTGFSDGFPILVASTSALAELNARLAARGRKPVPMDRFRPNVVLAGSAVPFVEDSWAAFKVSGADLKIVKPCSRCKIPTIDQSTGLADGADATTDDLGADLGGGPRHDAEPTATLKTFRSGVHLGYKAAWKNDVFFGQNVCHSSHGCELREGDLVTPKLKSAGCVVC